MFLYFCLCSKNAILVKLKGVHPTHTPTMVNCWFSRDVTKIQTTKLSIEPTFYYHDV